jgi:hypothetical protein
MKQGRLYGSSESLVDPAWAEPARAMTATDARTVARPVARVRDVMQLWTCMVGS